MDEIFGVPATAPNIALMLAGLIASLWGGSKVPWKAAIAKLLEMFQSKGTAVDGAGVDSDLDPGAEFMAAMYDLHRLAHDADEHKRLGQFTADWWAAQDGRDADQIADATDSMLR